MQSYTKKYMDHFGFDISDYIPCELELHDLGCTGKSTEIHHIRGRGPDFTDNVNNLIALCRSCHNVAHSSAELTEMVQKVHNAYIKQHKQSR